jgi:hypothetical protein
MAFMNFQGAGFQLEVPTDWLITSSPQFQSAFIAPAAKFGKANLTINTRSVEKNATLLAIATAARGMQAREFPKFEVISEGMVANTGDRAYERVYRWENDQNGAKIWQRQVLILIPGILLTVTATREDRENTQELDAIFEHMLSSFALEPA